MELWRTERGPDYLRKYGNLIHFIQTFATRTPPSSLPSCAAWLSCCKQSVGPRAVLACYISWRSLSYNHSDSPHIFISLLSGHFFPAFTSIDSDSRHTSWAQYNIFHSSIHRIHYKQRSLKIILFLSKCIEMQTWDLPRQLWLVRLSWLVLQTDWFSWCFCWIIVAVTHVKVLSILKSIGTFESHS